MKMMRSIIVICSLISLVASSCPPYEDVLPCYCHNDASAGRTDLNCGSATHEDEIENACKANFGTNNLFTFEIFENVHLTALTRNLFGNLTFVEHIISDTKIRFVDESVFENSFDTLEYIDYDNTNISEESFPFESLSKFTKLEHFALTSNPHFKHLPKITSSSIFSLQLRYNEIETIQDFSFRDCTGLVVLTLSNNKIKEIKSSTFLGATSVTQIKLENNLLTSLPPGTFTGLTSLQEIILSGNNIKTIGNAAFNELPSLVNLNMENTLFTELSPAMFYEVPHIQYLYMAFGNLNFVQQYTFENYLSSPFNIDLTRNSLTSLEGNTFTGLTTGTLKLENNNISAIEFRAFKGIHDSTINLAFNAIITLDQEWLEPVFVLSNTVDVQSNPLDCGCDIAWLFETPEYLGQLNGDPTCTDGILLKNIDQSVFDDC